MGIWQLLTSLNACDTEREPLEEVYCFKYTWGRKCQLKEDVKGTERMRGIERGEG